MVTGSGKKAAPEPGSRWIRDLIGGSSPLRTAPWYVSGNNPLQKYNQFGSCARPRPALACSLRAWRLRRRAPRAGTSALQTRRAHSTRERWTSSPSGGLSSSRNGGGRNVSSRSRGPTAGRVAHVGYVVSGRMKVIMDDSSETEYGLDDAVVVPPGPDAWIVRAAPCTTSASREPASTPARGAGYLGR